MLIASTLLLITGCSNNYNKDKVSEHLQSSINKVENMKNTLSLPKSDPVQDEIKKLTLNEKIGQMIIAGFDGTTVTTNATDLINKYKVKQ